MTASPILENLLAICEDFEASDLHITPGISPRFRIRGSLVEKGDIRPFQVKDVDAIATELGLFTLPTGCAEGTERVRTTLMREGAIDGALTSSSGVRYRFNVYRSADNHAVAIRRLESEFRSFEELGLPSRLADFCTESSGLVIVSGPTGSGKTTTLATMLNSINRSKCGHIVTIEDPIEYVHSSDCCIVNQRQVGRDTTSFYAALVEAMRQDPDVILVGEMRELETVRTALRAAETGHLVFSTLHAGDCAGAIERLISIFPAEEQDSARHQLALVLRGVFAQHLLSTPGASRALAGELLVNTPAVANLIATGRSAQIYSAIETGGQSGMRTLDQSLAELIRAGKIDERKALALSKHPEILKGRMALC